MEWLHIILSTLSFTGTVLLYRQTVKHRRRIEEIEKERDQAQLDAYDARAAIDPSLPSPFHETKQLEGSKR